MTTDLAARYAAAEALLPHNLKKLVLSAQARPAWVRDTETFWYRTRTAEGTRFFVVDAEAGTKQPAFDHVLMAEALRTVVDVPVDAAELPFAGIELRDGAVRVAVGDQRVAVSLGDYSATVLGPVVQGESTSPDGRWAVSLRDHNLWIRDTETDESRQLTTDGVEAYDYGVMTDAAAARVMMENLGGLQVPPLVAWSPDSSSFVTHRLDQRDLELMHLVRSSPLGGGRPKPMTYRYAMVGDEGQASSELFVFEAATGEATQAKCPPLHTPFVPTIAYGHLWWSEDNRSVFFLSSDRGDHNVQLNHLDPATGDVRVLVEESSASHITFGPQHQERNVRVLTTGEVLWWSQRSGYGHLYLYGTDGSVRALTQGEWVVRSVVSVDEAARRLVITAAGRLPGSDPYLQEICLLDLDTGHLTTVTEDGLDHDCVPSRSGRFFVDITSRYDTPTVSVLRNGAGDVVLELERADATALHAAGWSPAERVVVKAADGVTDVYCAIYKPHDFDPTKSYPVLDEIYAGPQISITPLRFPLAGGTMTGERSGAIFAALGFVVVAVDHRGSAMRHKAFQDDARLGGIGRFVDDHVAAITQLAETRPWMDLDRVGIFGHSGGGSGSTRAMLAAPDFFKVAVSSAGNHDDRIYHAWWGEKIFGLKDEYDYDSHANASLAANLKGKLFLVHGEMDDNVTPHHTMRLVDALIKENKDFDLLIVPNAEHAILVHTAYWIRRRWDYFVQHLLGETPPAYRIADIPVDPDYLAMMLGG